MISKTTNQSKWFAFYVKPRHEKKASERLQLDGFAVFCPLIKTKVKWHDRWKKVQKPFINGYIFAQVTEEERCELLNDPSVISTVCRRVNGLNHPAVIREREIEAMKFMTREAKSVEVFEGRAIKRQQIGNKVKVEHGPFSGFEGIIEKFSTNKISVKLDSLNMQLIVTLEPQDVVMAKE